MSKKGLETQRNYPLRKKCKEFFWGGWCMQTPVSYTHLDVYKRQPYNRTKK